MKITANALKPRKRSMHQLIPHQALQSLDFSLLARVHALDLRAHLGDLRGRVAHCRPLRGELGGLGVEGVKVRAQRGDGILHRLDHAFNAVRVWGRELHRALRAGGRRAVHAEEVLMRGSVVRGFENVGARLRCGRLGKWMVVEGEDQMVDGCDRLRRGYRYLPRGQRLAAGWID